MALQTNHTERTPSSWVRFLLLALLATGLFFRFANLDKKVYWHDEVWMSLRLTGHRGAEMMRDIYDGREKRVEDLQKYQRLDPEKNTIDAISALAIEDPKHPPLYYALGRFWLNVFDGSIRSTRSLSAFLSLLAFPALYWLCRELFEPTQTALVATALMAVSPFHVLYAQEAYQYSLWTVTILLSCAALLRATRLQTTYSWGIYAGTLAIGLYTHILFVLVMVGHGLYVASISLQRVNLGKFRLPQIPTAYLLATLAGLGLFSPWATILILKFPDLYPGLAFLNRPLSFVNLLRLWSQNFNGIFLDIGSPSSSIATRLAGFASWVILGLSAFGIYFLHRSTPSRTRLFLFTLAGTTFMSLALVDLILGGRRSAIPRYSIPSYLGVQLAVAHLISTQLSSASSLRRKISRAAIVFLVTSGIISCAVISTAETWWNKYGAGNIPRLARMINQSSKPLIIADTNALNTGNVISLSYRVDPKTRFLLVATPRAPTIPNGFSEVFLYNPSPDLIRSLQEQEHRSIQPLFENELWQLQGAATFNER